MLDHSQKAHIDEILKINQELKENSGLSHEIKNELSHLHDQIGRGIRQFGSDTLILVTAGMLKSGKSTLVNLLARTQNASPTGFGFDTTLRPALICQMRDRQSPGKITVYKCPDAGKFSDEIGKAFDHVRGLTPDHVPDHFELELTNANLVKILCCSPAESGNLLTHEPALVVVHVPYNEYSLLNEKRMIFDMPGLDSAHAEVVTRNAYSRILRECDLVLFLQSSVAPLNEKASEVLNDIRVVRMDSSLWVLQNMMEFKPWLDDQIVASEQKNQLKRAEEVIKKIGGGHNYEFLKSNLGKAFDSIFNRENFKDYPKNHDIGAKFLQDSLFLEMENRLRQEIDSNGSKVRYQRCIAELDIKIRDLDMAVCRTQQGLEPRRSELQGKKEKIGQLLQKIDQYINYRKPGNVPEVTADFKEDIGNIVIQMFDRNECGVNSNKVKAEAINHFFRECNSKCKAATEQRLRTLEWRDLWVDNMRAIEWIDSEAGKLVREAMLHIFPVAMGMGSTEREVSVSVFPDNHESCELKIAIPAVSNGPLGMDIAVMEREFIHKPRKGRTWLLTENCFSNDEVKSYLLTGSESVKSKLSEHYTAIFREEVRNRCGSQVADRIDGQVVSSLRRTQEDLGRVLDQLEQTIQPLENDIRILKEMRPCIQKMNHSTSCAQ